VTSTGGPAIRVFLLDDHVMIRQMLRDRLGREPDMEVVGEAGAAGAALPVVWSLRPEVAVLDKQLPDGDGVEVCRDIRADQLGDRGAARNVGKAGAGRRAESGGQAGSRGQAGTRSEPGAIR
jgi:CheY-like chemotaxis protein